MATRNNTRTVTEAVLKARDAEMKKKGWGGSVTGRLDIEEWGAGIIVEGIVTRLKKLPDRMVGTKMKEGGTLFYIDTTDGSRCYGAPAILLETLEAVELPAKVNILCLGKIIPTNKGSDAWGFDVRIFPNTTG